MFLFVLLLLTDITYYREYKEIVDNETCHSFSTSENVPYTSDLEEGYCVEYKDISQNITSFKLKNKTHDCDSKIECNEQCDYKDFINENFSDFSYIKCVSDIKSPSLPPHLPPPPEENTYCDEYEFKPYSFSDTTEILESEVYSDTKLFKELKSDDYYIDNNTIINKCCQKCSDDFCYGFNVIVKEKNVTCKLARASGTHIFEHTSQYFYKEKFAYIQKVNIPPPPSPPPPPTVTITPVEWYVTFLQPEVFIPSIIGTILLLIVFIYLFRECTTERATAFSSIIDSLLGRQKTEVIIA